MILSLICCIFGHRRSGSRVHRVDGVWHSRCKRCGAALLRVRHAKWRVVAD
jgi:hypothetical protein